MARRGGILRPLRRSLSRRIPRPSASAVLRYRRNHATRSRAREVRRRPDGQRRRIDPRRDEREYFQRGRSRGGEGRGRRDGSAEDDPFHAGSQYGRGDAFGDMLDTRAGQNSPHIRLGHGHLRNLRRTPNLLPRNPTKICPHGHRNELRLPLQPRISLPILLPNGERLLVVQGTVGVHHRHPPGVRGRVQYVYRFLFYCLMASVSWSYKGLLGYITGILLGCVAVFNTYILVKYPAYRKMREQIAAEEDKRIQGKINQQVRKQAISNMGWGK